MVIRNSVKNNANQTLPTLMIVALNDHYDICDVGYRLCLDKGNADEHCSTSRTFCFNKCDLFHDKCLHEKDVKSCPSLPASAAVLFQASKELFATIPDRNGIPCETRCDEEVETCQRRCASHSCSDGCWHMRHGCIDECRPERDLAIQQILAHPTVSCAANCSAQKAECVNSCRGDSQCLAKCDNKHFVCEQLCMSKVAYRSEQSRCTDDCQSVFVGCLSFVQGISKEEAATRRMAERERCFHKCGPKKKERATQLLSTAQDPVAPKEWNSVNTNTQSVAPSVNKNASSSTPSRYPTLEQSEDSPQFSYELCDEMCRRAESVCQAASRGDKLLSLQCLEQKKECSHLCVDENNPLPTTPCTPRCHEGYQKCSSQCDSSFSSADERSECDSECWRERSSCVRRCPFSPDEDVSQCDLSCHAAFEEGLEKCGEADLFCLETITSQRKDCFSLCKSPAELKPSLSSASSSPSPSPSSPSYQPSSADYSSEEDFQAQLDGCNEYCDVLTRGCQSECKYGFTRYDAGCRAQDSKCLKVCSVGEDPSEPMSNAERWKKRNTGVSLDDCVRSCEGSTINSPGEYDACYNKCRYKRKTSLELCDRIYKGPYKDTNSDRNTGLTSSSSVDGQSDASESGWSQESDLLPQTALLRLCQSSCSTGFNDCSAKCERSGAGRACHDDCMGSRRRCEAQCTEDYSSKPKEEEGKEVKLDCTGQCKASLHSCLEMCLGNSICESQCVAQARDCEARCSQPKDLCSRVCAAERAKCQASCNGRLSCEKQCQRGEVECIPLCLNERGDPKCIGECREKQMLCEGSYLTSRKEDCSAGCAKNYRQCANSCVREDDGGDDPANPLQSQSVDASLSEQNERDRKTTQQKQEEEKERKEFEERYPTAQQSAASQSSGDGEVASPEEFKRRADGLYVDTLMNKCSSIQNPRCYDEIWTKHSKLLKACQTQNSAILTTFVCEYYFDEQCTESFNTCG
ncbi:uncharacterized protein MONOS_4138 [Monocercomonoides exilis]|uniref:uncharacterized protein n=1 Tax=Monocercomonoides exilis TaxID=2049356 RepID=UPI003559B6CD|nr:hypothetical protein MONOS_4138 [Monocercomonoides exilis]|eukprot:MONOS_4138.1-p1 / transcript=MONOS_4138.1 / gene=MONOS_4138 / organism=Monocercomonoides_exilis_PA203 / gene_product=unspecified product / transcript_product=unspecified product / location=Mono_scaffold00106:43309-47265(-) / protein_length=974 / sequence_SO=supercontig / SO=protein_coding / is_pseudo=false